MELFLTTKADLKTCGLSSFTLRDAAIASKLSKSGRTSLTLFTIVTGKHALSWVIGLRSGYNYTIAMFKSDQSTAACTKSKFLEFK